MIGSQCIVPYHKEEHKSNATDMVAARMDLCVCLCTNAQPCAYAAHVAISVMLQHVDPTASPWHWIELIKRHSVRVGQFFVGV